MLDEANPDHFPVGAQGLGYYSKTDKESGPNVEIVLVDGAEQIKKGYHTDDEEIETWPGSALMKITYSKKYTSYFVACEAYNMELGWTTGEDFNIYSKNVLLLY